MNETHKQCQRKVENSAIDLITDSVHNKLLLILNNLVHNSKIRTGIHLIE